MGNAIFCGVTRYRSAFFLWLCTFIAFWGFHVGSLMFLWGRTKLISRNICSHFFIAFLQILRIWIFVKWNERWIVSMGCGYISYYSHICTYWVLLKGILRLWWPILWMVYFVQFYSRNIVSKYTSHSKIIGLNIIALQFLYYPS